MARQGPPEEEDVDDGGRSLVLLVDAIDTLGLNAHLPIQPFLAAAQLPQDSRPLLELARANHLLRVRVCWFRGDNALLRIGVGWRGVAALRVMLGRGGRRHIVSRTVVCVLHVVSFVGEPAIGLVAVDEISHCSSS